MTSSLDQSPGSRIRRQLQHALKDSHPTVRFISLDLFRKFLHTARNTAQGTTSDTAQEPNRNPLLSGATGEGSTRNTPLRSSSGEGESLNELVIGLLRDGDRHVKWLAIVTCGEHGLHAALPELVKLLENPDQTTRQLAAAAMSRIGEAQVLPALVQNFRTEASANVRKHLITNLDRFPDLPWDILATATQDSDMGIRLEAARLLGRLAPDATACEILVKLLEKETNAQVFATAILALGLFRREVLLGYFQHSLMHQENRIRANAVEALGNLPLTRIQALIAPYLKDPSNRVKANVIGIFLQHAMDETVHDRVKGLLSSVNRWDRASGAWVVGTYRLADLFPHLVRLLNEDDTVVAGRAAWAIGRLDDPEAFASLTRLYGQTHSHTQHNVLMAMGHVARNLHGRTLGNLVGRELNPQLKARMIDILTELAVSEAKETIRPYHRDPDPRVRSSALRYLALVHPLEAAETLVFMLRDPQPEIRRQCAEDLLALGDFRGLKTLVQFMTDPEKARILQTTEKRNDPRGQTPLGRC